jgi:hypothetical protein
MRLRSLAWTWFLFLGCLAAAQSTPPPVLFFSDLDAGAASGNPDTTYSSTGGVYVTLYGNFLDSPTVVQLNGASCLTTVSAPKAWLWYERMVVKLGAGCTTGNFTVTTAAGTSNGIAFTVNSGHVYYVATSGNDSTGTGSFSAPWKTLLKARDTIAAGDTVYAENGVAQITDDGQGWNTCFLLHNGGTSGNPFNFAVYPGATATIGSTTPVGGGCGDAVRSGAFSSAETSYWTFAEFTMQAAEVWAFAFSDHIRIVGTDESCPTGNGQSGCFEASETNHYNFYGNNMHNSGVVGATTEWHEFYPSSDSNEYDIGWNTIAGNHGGRGIHIHSSVNGVQFPGHNQFNIAIHDNMIHDIDEDCIILVTVDPSQGPITVYNNVLWNCGLQTPPEGGSGAWNGIYYYGSTNAGTPGTGTTQTFNNTVYSWGTNPSPPYADEQTAFNYAGANANQFQQIRNNLFLSVTTTGFSSGVPYLFEFNPNTSGACAPTDNCPWIFGTNNLMFGAGTNAYDTANVTGTVSSNPNVTNASGHDFTLTASSPAIGAGTAISVTPYGVNWTGHDIQGLTRHNPPSIGAYEYGSSSGSGSPNPPTNLTATVH